MIVRHRPETGERHLDLLKWGLLPYFTKDPVHAKRPINARAETVATSGMQVSIRSATLHRPGRCVLRVEACRRRQAAVRYLAPGRSANGIRRGVGGIQVARWHGDTFIYHRHHVRQRDYR
jgi:hypothetical protein